MKQVVLVALCGLLFACSGTESAKIAAKGVDQFHAELNAGHYAQLYEKSAPDMKAATKPDQFVAFLTGAHNKLGAFKSGKQVGWNDNHATGGHFVTLQYESQFERGPAQEQFVFRFNNDQAILVGYNINSSVFVTG